MNKKGFTLVELIAVIAVLAVLVLVALPNVLGVFNKSIEEVMKIEETQATDAGNLYVRDHCGRTAKSKNDRSKCRNDVTTQKIEDKVYFCLSEIRGKGYIDEIKYKGNTKCDGIVLYDYDDEEVKFSEGKTYLVCDNDLYITPELKEKEESIFNEYKKIINECPDSSYEPAPAPEPTPGSTPNPDSNENNNMYKVIVVHDVIGIGDEEIYLKYGIGWYSDANGANAINKINTKVKTGHTLKGYYTEQNGNGIQIIDENGNINSGTTTAINTEISSIYAYWEPSKFYITYNANGGTGEKMPDTLFEYGVEQALSKNTYTREGYTFAGWSQSPNGSVTYIDSKVVKFTPLDTSNWNLYAIWTPSIYKLTLNNDGATTPGTTKIYEKYNTGWYSEQEGTNKLTSIVVPVKKGYTFNGYNLNGTEIIKDTGVINNNTTVINTDTETTASYTPRTYSVILNTGGADTPGTPAIYLKYNTGWYSNYEATESIAKITVPQKNGYEFNGYYTGEDGEGTQVIDSNGNIKNGNTRVFSNETNTGTIYAKWKFLFKEFDYTGDVQIFNVPVSGNYKLEVWGASGHYWNENHFGGYGGYSIGSINLSKNDKLYVVVGGAGEFQYGYGPNQYVLNCINHEGYNGGGKSSAAKGSGAGGGATHIANVLEGDGTLLNYESKIDNIIIVAGGGGGYNGNFSTSFGGSGGGFKGGKGTTNSDANIGTQTSPGTGQVNASFGKAGGSSCSYHAAPGGGGGYYGGSGGPNHGGGAGGSGYIGNKLLKNVSENISKHMVGYKVPTSGDANTLTYSVDLASDTPKYDTAKKGNGFAMITYIEE